MYDMMRKSLIFCSLLVLCGCGHNANDEHGHSHEEEASEHATHEQGGQGHNDENLVVLDKNMAKRFGVKVDTVQSGNFAPAISCSAQIERAVGSESVVAAPISGIVTYKVNAGAKVGAGAVVAKVTPGAVAGGDLNRGAKAALNAAQAEVNRLRPLYEQRLCTAAEWQAALAALEQAKAAYAPGAANGTATASTSGVVAALLAADGSYVEAGTPLAQVVNDDRLIATARVSAEHYAALGRLKDVRLLLGDGSTLLLSEQQGQPGGVTSDGGYCTVTYGFRNPGNVAPGLVVEARLLTQGSKEAVSVPRDALTENQGDYYVYREVMPLHFEKVKVTPGVDNGDRVEILSGLQGGQRVAISGATTLRLKEASGAVPAGHNHSH